MAQTDNPFLDGVAKVFTDAAGAAQNVRAEIDSFVKQRLERLVSEMDFVPREEFEAVKAMAARARSENEALRAQLAVLEAQAGGDRSLSLPVGANRQSRKLWNLLVHAEQAGESADSCAATKSCVRLVRNCFVWCAGHAYGGCARAGTGFRSVAMTVIHQDESFSPPASARHARADGRG